MRPATTPRPAPARLEPPLGLWASGCTALARILRASRIYKRWVDYFGMSYALQSLLRFLVLTCVLAHWLACLWGFFGQRVDESAPDTWHARLPIVLQPYSAGAAQFEHPFSLYGVCLYTALTNIFGGSCEINPNSASEYYIQATMMLCGSSVWAYVIGSCCGILATLNPALIEFRQTMDELNVFVKDHDMPQELSVRLRQYFRNTMYLIRTRRYEQLLAKMSKRLRGDASLIVATRAFRRVWYLADPRLEAEVSPKHPHPRHHVCVCCRQCYRLRCRLRCRLRRCPC